MLSGGIMGIACAGFCLRATTVFAQDTAPAGENGASTSTSNSCDYSDLSAKDITLRESLEYAELSPFGPAKDCTNCSYYMAPKSGFCGECTIIRGAVHPKGYCTSWEII